MGAHPPDQPSFAVAVGDSFPGFDLPTQHRGETLRLDDLRDAPVVLYFYPRDNTPGCTLQADDAQRLLPMFAALGLKVAGVSVDSAESHEDFAVSCGLSFPLLADSGGELSRRLGILTSDPRFPELGTYAQRVTFILDGDGTIVWMWAGTSRGHMDQVLEAAARLFGEAASNETKG